ncbi:MAG TPA: DUF1349 domain-containing protein [Ideonella sp.]|nr:DUF1349 domain-containing protein [Ideonella sp.]
MTTHPTTSAQAPTAALHETFDGPALAPALRWFCEPARWSLGRGLQVATGAGTDFWQRTHYGFEVDNGHFLHLQARGDFVLSTRVNFRPRHQYDQAGLMLRLSPSCWVKTSVEFEPDEPSRLGVVVTNAQYSDWSTQPLAKDIGTLWFKLRVEGTDCIVQSSLDGQAWQQLRMAHLAELDPGRPVACGLYACSPKAAGYEAEFHFLSLLPGRDTSAAQP